MIKIKTTVSLVTNSRARQRNHHTPTLLKAQAGVWTSWIAKLSLVGLFGVFPAGIACLCSWHRSLHLLLNATWRGPPNIWRRSTLRFPITEYLVFATLSLSCNRTSPTIVKYMFQFASQTQQIWDAAYVTDDDKATLCCNWTGHMFIIEIFNFSVNLSSITLPIKRIIFTS